MSKTTTKTKAAKETTTAAAEPTKREPAAKDGMGCRVGSQSAAINAAITNKPQTVATLAEAAGCTAARVRNHLRYLLAKELIVETDEGYSTPPKAQAPAKRAPKAAK
jgi:hypothetical protein